MKRSETLAPLSREHHSALVLAQLLKKNSPDYKGLPKEVADKVSYAINMFQYSLKQHFDKEEILLEKTKQYHPDIKKMADEIILEHIQLTNVFESLKNNLADADVLDSLGNALDQHIRKEERVLFPLIQEHCPEEILKNIEELHSL